MTKTRRLQGLELAFSQRTSAAVSLQALGEWDTMLSTLPTLRVLMQSRLSDGRARRYRRIPFGGVTFDGNGKPHHAIKQPNTIASTSSRFGT